jgi:signal peptidase I
VYHQYQRKKKKLTLEQNQSIRRVLHDLQTEILNKNTARANELSQEAESLAKIHLRKTPFEHVRDLVFAIVFALAVAILVRQMWFEFYEIPTGSMRPTLKEKDRLLVSKTDFGINLPLTTEHLYFDPNLVQRAGIFIFTGENMDIRDVDTMYFYIFPGKKQYVKRLLGKPGDTLYFYGGKIYGVDSNGKDITSELNPEDLPLIDHIPFMHFEGKVSTAASPVRGIYSPVVLYQMNEPVARLFLDGKNQVKGEMLNPPQIRSSFAKGGIKEYGDLWGFKNFAMARLLTKEQAIEFSELDPSALEPGALYLELQHHPSFSNATIASDAWGRLRPMLGHSTSIIPLQEDHLRFLFDHLYTARFLVKKGKAYRYGASIKDPISASFLPSLSDVPDGCYEFYYGKAYEVLWQGITKELPSSHPLYRFTPDRLMLFFNLGIDFNLHFAPYAKNQPWVPSRYAYFRDQDLYVMGTPLLKKDDPTLSSFIKKEQEKQTTSASYAPFVDLGPPTKEDGSLNVDFIHQYGLTIPAKSYLALGDNHAMSGDSRDFGFVPQGNVRGGPDFIFWPPGPRFGAPNQPPYPLFNLPRTVIWAVVATILFLWWFFHRRHERLPYKDL